MEFNHSNVDSGVDKYGTHVSTGEIIEILNTEFSDVTEGLDNNTESLLEIGLKSVNNHMEICDSPEEVDIAENSNGRSISENLHYTQVSARENIKIIASLIRDDNHEKENEVIEITD